MRVALDFPRLPRAECLTVDPEIFFPGPEDSSEPAKTVCRYCDDRADCLTWAIEHDEQSGVWGGMTVKERNLLSGRGRRGQAA